ncbi:MAG: inositol phosphorylceramide synthase [Bacteroidetes bacterium]|nr:MAG: inositol phosphorylceramide synthase [Bacteroidota bacterium]REK07033.1 MAG: inositol phosphorylceramide synthase [Bacteroidota bacterium]REK33620.1 MAG: inositol phosphorylceramide synthase [Bacteroidota bacterium]REK48605.1 MAG: inositol phosphorylceramide synthase [Bacteroidota bacterium]
MSDPGNKISLNGALTVLGVSGLYVLYAWLSGGVRADQWQLLVLFLGCYFVGGAARRFILAFSVFLVYWWLYDSMKLYPNYLFKSVSIQELYNLEKKFFGFEYAGKIVMPSEYFQANLSTFLDVGTAIFYLCWIPVPLVFAFILFLKDQTLFLRFSIAFFIINLIGFVIYYLYPAAPPWYVTEYGFIHDYSVKSNPAGLLRFDQLIGFPLFEGIYSKGSNVFAAMPSLHSAYPLAVFYYGRKLGSRSLNAFFFTIMTGIWFSAVYLNHHYVLDVLAGIICAVGGIWVFEKIRVKPWASALLEKYYKIISAKK